MRLIVSQDLRDDDDPQMLGQPSPMTPSPGSQASPITPPSMDLEEKSVPALLFPEL